ncbi:DNA polymerase/3'-5' exonuclease PolX [Sulfoacidibacillus thermotolerans]|uniref:Polymerase/histidinol phosphatase N-terminal domain-containing protein n=1 Tax=Sulfoacidibacillus thermotolerans TaxID=1765684 RepID=A0A2U3D8R8_SULT2|nr:DNA polymerase/3'-5' exonuclease PolX [Sulfoacidibacillus thermotolerans]PWI57665.1 hypothetical protein BM613_07700 [Sulfoacidibacillus thermotolerans]
MDKRGVARTLRAISSLYALGHDEEKLALQYKKAADTIRRLPVHVQLGIDELQKQFHFEEPIRQTIELLLTKGRKAALLALPIDVPLSLLEIMELPGFGPKLTGRLYRTLHICSLRDLEIALNNGKIQFARILPESQLQQLPMEIYKLRQRNRAISIPTGREVAAVTIEHLHRTYPHLLRIEMTGSLRRMCPISTTIELLASWDGDTETLAQLQMNGFSIQHDTRTTNQMIESEFTAVTLTKEVEHDDRTFPLTVHLVSPESFALAWVLTTGDDAHAKFVHNRLNIDPQKQVASLRAQHEEEVYQLIDHPYLLPEMREQWGLHQEARKLLQEGQIKGDLHMHSRDSDGADPIEAMVQRCIEKGYTYLAITDHSQSLDIAHGLTVDRLLRQREEIAALREKYPQITILHGTEVDILADATLDFDDLILASLDFVVASIHTAMTQSANELTARLLYAIESPHVDIIGHPTGRMLGHRESYSVDFDRIFAAAEHNHIALELNCNPNRLDLDPIWLRQAMESHCLFAVDSDAHSVRDLERLTLYGSAIGRKGLLTPERVINTWELSHLLQWLATS